MYRAETLDVQGNPMHTLVLEPKGAGPHPGLMIAQHLPVAHAGLEKDPFTLDLGQRYDGAGHGFQDFNDQTRYRKEQSEDAWEKGIAFLDQHLK